MGRPRQYGSGAERQRAFRQLLEAEWARVNGAAFERLKRRLEELQQAVWAAQDAGDEIGQACSAASVETVLERVIGHFQERARASQLLKQEAKRES